MKNCCQIMPNCGYHLIVTNVFSSHLSQVCAGVADPDWQVRSLGLMAGSTWLKVSGSLLTSAIPQFMTEMVFSLVMEDETGCWNRGRG